MCKKLLASLLAVVMLISMVPAAVLAADFADTDGHWAESSIGRWSEYNIVEGYDGGFHPDESLTRGQMAKILSVTLGLTKTAGNPFNDVPSGAWYTPYVLRCYAAGIMLGDGAKANPDAPVSRQETMTMFCRALGIAPAANADLSGFADGGSVASWAAPYMAAMVQAGIITGVGDNQVAPGSDMTRASFMTMLDRTVVQYINEPGTYTLTDGKGIILVAAENVTLTGTTSADILVSAAAGGESLTFDGATVTGSITIQADNVSVNNKDSNLPQIVITGVPGGSTPSGTTPSGGASGGGGGSSSGGGGGGGGSSGNGGNSGSGGNGGSGGGGNSGGGSDTSEPTKITTPGTTWNGEDGNTAAEYEDVVITAGVGDGNVTLQNLTIKGNLTIEGGGSSSIILENVKVLGQIFMKKLSGETPRLLMKGATELDPTKPIKVSKVGAIIEKDNAATSDKEIKITAEAKVEIRGEETKIAEIAVPSGVTTSDGVEIKVTGGTVDNVTAESKAKITAGTAVDGTAKGTVGTVTAKTSEVTVESSVVEKVVVPEDASGDVKIEVTGDEKLEVVVNTEKKVDITTGADENGTGGADIDISTDLDQAPENVTVNGDENNKPHVHVWQKTGTVTKNPTCTEPGETTFECSDQNCPGDGTGSKPATKIEKLPAATGVHDVKEWTPDDGGETHSGTCESCKEEQTAKHADENKDNKCDVCDYDMSTGGTDPDPDNPDPEDPDDALTEALEKLNAAIAAAEEALEGVTKSEDGSNVSIDEQWATQEDIAKLDAAIKTAQAALKAAQDAPDDADAEELTTAAETLEGAVETFKAACKPGTQELVKATQAELQKAIDEAEKLLADTVPSDDGTGIPSTKYWATSDAIEELQGAIDEATRALTKTTVDELNAAIATLKEAVEAFEDEAVRQPGNAEPTKKDELEAAIKEAKALLEGVEESEDGNDVLKGTQWVTGAEMKALTDAIDTAQGVLDKSEPTDDELTQAKTALEGEMETFRTARKEGTKASKEWTALDTAIKEAEAKKAEVTKSDDAAGTEIPKGEKFATQSQIEALEKAIKAAQDVLDKEAEATDVELINAKSELNKDVSAFETEVAAQTAAKDAALETKASSLSDAIKEAEKLQASATESEEKGADVPTTEKWVTADEMKALTDAISAANTAHDADDATQNSLDKALKALEGAMETFGKALKDGAMEDGGDDNEPTPLEWTSDAGSLTMTWEDESGAKSYTVTFTPGEGEKATVTETVDGTVASLDVIKYAVDLLGAEKTTYTVTVTGDDSTPVAVGELTVTPAEALAAESYDYMLTGTSVETTTYALGFASDAGDIFIWQWDEDKAQSSIDKINIGLTTGTLTDESELNLYAISKVEVDKEDASAASFTMTAAATAKYSESGKKMAASFEIDVSGKLGLKYTKLSVPETKYWLSSEKVSSTKQVDLATDWLDDYLLAAVDVAASTEVTDTITISIGDKSEDAKELYKTAEIVTIKEGEGDGIAVTEDPDGTFTIKLAEDGKVRYLVYTISDDEETKIAKFTSADDSASVKVEGETVKDLKVLECAVTSDQLTITVNAANVAESDDAGDDESDPDGPEADDESEGDKNDSGDEN